MRPPRIPVRSNGSNGSEITSDAGVEGYEYLTAIDKVIERHRGSIVFRKKSRESLPKMLPDSVINLQMLTAFLTESSTTASPPFILRNNMR